LYFQTTRTVENKVKYLQQGFSNTTTPNDTRTVENKVKYLQQGFSNTTTPNDIKTIALFDWLYGYVLLETRRKTKLMSQSNERNKTRKNDTHHDF
jgi:hypothetical protein